MEIDPRFKQAQQSAARRRTRGQLAPVLLWGTLGLAVIGLGAGLYLSGVLTIGTPGTQVTETGPETDVPADTGATYASPFVDLAGDPMVLRFDRSAGAEKTTLLLRPAEISSVRAGADLLLLNDEMITGQERLITTLPSSREDFAFFQSQKAGKPKQPLQAASPPAQGGAGGEVVVADEAASWGDSLGGAEPAGPATYTRTRIENTTSLAFIQPEAQRRPPWEDVFLRLKGPAVLLDILTENGMDATASARFAEQAALLLPATAALDATHILAVRGADRNGRREPVQLSLYTRDSYLGSLAVSDAGQVVTGADPWVAEDLFSFAGDAVAGTDVSRKYRLLDAFYSAAIRNGVPSAIVGETIVMMSQAHDLEAFASPGDTMTLLYARDPGAEGAGPGQVLYAAIRGQGRELLCHVTRATPTADYACFNGQGGGGAGDGVGLRAGLRSPTAGVLTSTYGPRMHPVLKIARLHRGVDWAAPIGTPVTAAFDGTIAAAGDGKGYGNLVRIDHGGGMETRYAHLNAFAAGIAAGVAVKAGDLIGYIGTTGLSTGPHLHFEVWQDGDTVDPLAPGGGGGGGADTQVADASAVEKLTDVIIHVESGGKADAKNPLSTATGLGQFIEGTWLRMMTTYRPDLASSMTREALLALRTDPTISREMVTNLAREGEAYLRARGHTITAGRLYLCHFLGADGAARVLSAADAALLADVLGAGVVNANPFLKGRDVAYVKDWAEAKMSGKAGTVRRAVVIPPEVLAYQKVIETLLNSKA